ncbi:MAG: hypothetical protein U5N86_13515 [Planctomycetota bacterium]|nr:hypothetical protein [Planctomycetota bacterium]
MRDGILPGFSILRSFAPLLCLLGAAFAASAGGEGLRLFAPAHLSDMGGGRRYYVAAGKGNGLRFGPLLEFSELVSSFDGMPDGPKQFCPLSNKDTVVLSGGRLYVIGESGAWRLVTAEGLTLPSIVGMQRTEEGVFFWTDDGYGFVTEEHCTYSGGFELARGANLVSCAAQGDSVWMLADTGQCYVKNLGGQLQRVACPDGTRWLFAGHDTLYCLAAGGRIARHLGEGTWEIVADGFSDARYALVDGYGAFFSKDSVFVASEGEVLPFETAPFDISLRDGGLSVEGDPFVWKKERSKLPGVLEPVGDVRMLAYMADELKVLHSFSGFDEPSDMKADLQPLNPLSGTAFMREGRLHEVLLSGRVVSSRELPEPLTFAHPARFNDYGSPEWLCRGESGAFYLFTADGFEETEPVQFWRMITGGRNYGSVMRFFEEEEPLDLLKTGIGSSFSQMGLLLLRPSQARIVRRSDLTFIRSYDSRDGVPWLGCVSRAGRLALFNRRAVYSVIEEKLVESYRPGPTCTIVDATYTEDSLAVLTRAGLVKLPLDFEFLANAETESLKVSARFSDATLGLEPPVVAVGKARTELKLRSSGDFADLSGSAVLDGGKDLPLQRLVCARLLLGEFEIPFVRPVIAASDTNDAASLAASVEDDAPYPPGRALPRLDLAAAVQKYGSGGGNFLSTDQLSGSVSLRSCKLELLPAHRFGKRTFMGIERTNMLAPSDGRWLAVGEPVRLSVVANGTRLAEVSFDSPQIMQFEPHLPPQAYSVCVLGGDGFVALPTHYSAANRVHSCVIPPSVWKARRGQADFALCAMLLGDGPQFAVLDGRKAFLHVSKRAGEVSLPTGNEVRFAAYEGDEFIFGGRIRNGDAGMSWSTDSFRAEEFTEPRPPSLRRRPFAWPSWKGTFTGGSPPFATPKFRKMTRTVSCFIRL